jgi:hypothetical protein
MQINPNPAPGANAGIDLTGLDPASGAPTARLLQRDAGGWRAAEVEVRAAAAQVHVPVHAHGWFGPSRR